MLMTAILQRTVLCSVSGAESDSAEESRGPRRSDKGNAPRDPRVNGEASADLLEPPIENTTDDIKVKNRSVATTLEDMANLDETGVRVWALLLYTLDFLGAEAVRISNMNTSKLQQASLRASQSR